MTKPYVNKIKRPRQFTDQSKAGDFLLYPMNQSPWKSWIARAASGAAAILFIWAFTAFVLSF